MQVTGMAVYINNRSERCCSDIARPEKIVIFDPSKGTGGLLGNKKHAHIEKLYTQKKVGNGGGHSLEVTIRVC